MLAACSPSAAQIWRVKAATDVLPLVPVTAAITSGWRGKNFAAASASARRASPTLTKATPSGSGSGGTRSAMTAAAPRRQRLADEAQPVVLGAGHRHEQVARLDRAAVRADARDVERGEARVADGIHGEQVLELHVARSRSRRHSLERRRELYGAAGLLSCPAHEPEDDADRISR